MRLTFDPVWSWPLVAIASLVLLLVVVLTYPQHVRHLSRRWRFALIALRTACVLLLIFSMLRPALQVSETDRRRTEIALLLDNSRSMNTPDAPGGLTRREALVKLMSDHQELLDKLAAEVDLRLVDFSQHLQPIAQPSTNADGPITAIGTALDELREQSQGDRLAGVLLLSDGAERSVGEDPLQAARKIAEQKGAPIHGVVLGTSDLTTGGLDLAVEDLVLDQPVTFERKTVPVHLQVRLLGAAGRSVKVRLLMEDRTGKALGQSGPLKEIPLTSETRPFREIRTRENAAIIPVELSFMADQPGEYKIAAEVVPAEGEVKVSNNRLETLISVRKGGLRVAYFDVLRTEQKFLRELNETAKIQLDTQFVLAGARGQRTLIDPRLFEPRAFDVYILGDIPLAAFQGQGRQLLNLLAARVNEGAGLAVIGGWQASGGYSSTALAELIPVKLGPTEGSALNKPVRVLPTPDGERHYLMRLSGADNERVWRGLPELRGGSRLTPKSGAVDVLAESAGGDPLMIATDTGRGRVVALGVDDTWRWHMHGFSADHQRFWQQLMLWLARKEFDTDQPIWVRVEPRNFTPRSRVPVEFGAQDANGNPLSDVTFEAEVIRPDGKHSPLVAQRSNTGGFAEYSDTDVPGDYWVRVAATQGGKALGMSAMTRFVVDARDPELDNPSADPALMGEIAAMTGGTLVPAEEFGTFLTSLLEEGIPSELKRYRRINLWDGWPLLLIFVVFMTAEWTIRKVQGLV